MLGIINYKDRRIYITEENNEIVYYYLDNKNKIYLDYSIIALLLSSIFNKEKEVVVFSNSTLKITKNTEDLNYHFYYNGVEDYIDFFKHNNRPRILCDKSFNKNSFDKIKKAITIRSKVITIFIIEITLLANLSSIIKTYPYHLAEEKVISSLNLDNPEVNSYYDYDLDTILEESNFDDFLKTIINNSKLFEDLEKTKVTEDRIISLDNKLHNINVRLYSDKEANDDELNNSSGYYSELSPNEISVRYYDYRVILHEFIHLLQDDNDYLYLKEASAELLTHEYFLDTSDNYVGDYVNSKGTTYSEEVKRLCVLMEIIGPEVIWNLNFSGSTKEFKDEIYKYLDKEDANEFLYLLKTPKKIIADMTTSEERELNRKIDNILAKMYMNKFNKPIEEDILINSIYNNNPDEDITNNRRYFCDSETKHSDIII